MREYDKLYIGGEWVAPLSPTGTIEVFDSSTEEVIGRVAQGGAADVDAAVAAAWCIRLLVTDAGRRAGEVPP